MSRSCYHTRKHHYILLCIIITCLFLFTPFTVAQERATTTIWESIGPEGGRIQALATHPSNSNTIYAAPFLYPCPIFKSTDAGNSWIEISQISDDVRCLCTSSTNPDLIYASGTGKIYISTNSGSTWTTKYVPQSGSYLYDMAVDPGNPNILHVTGDGYTAGNWVFTYYRSTNGGTDWTTYSLDDGNWGYGNSVAMDPYNTGNLFVGGYISGSGGRVFKSTDGGTSWTDITGTVSGEVYDVLCDPGTSNKVFAATSSGIYRSSNGGTSWTKNSGYCGNNYQLAVDPANSNIVYSGAYDRVYRSSDGGNNWTSCTAGLYGEYTNGFCVHGTTTSTLYLANRSGFFKSTDSGDNWNASNSGLLMANITVVRLDPSNPKKMYTAFYSNGLYKTDDATAKAFAPMTVSWEKMPDFYSCHNLEDIIIDPSNPDRLVAMEGGG